MRALSALENRCGAVWVNCLGSFFAAVCAGVSSGSADGAIAGVPVGHDKTSDDLSVNGQNSASLKSVADDKTGVQDVRNELI